MYFILFAAILKHERMFTAARAGGGFIQQLAHFEGVKVKSWELHLLALLGADLPGTGSRSGEAVTSKEDVPAGDCEAM